MENLQIIVTIGSILIALVSLVTGFILQYDAKETRELKRKNKQLSGNLKKAVKAIQGYQLIENKLAKTQNTEVALYRKKIRKDINSYFDKDFLVPTHIDQLDQKLNS